MSAARENQERPLAQLHAGQLAVRISSLTSMVRRFDEELAHLGGARAGAHSRASLKELKARRKRAEKEIKAARQRLGLMRAAANP
jgi:hypothetical protein